MEVFSKLKNFNLLAAVVVFVITVVPTMLVINLNRELSDKREKIGFIILGDIKTPGWNEQRGHDFFAATLIRLRRRI